MNRKIFILIVSIFITLLEGSCNIYPLYLNFLMDKFNYTKREVNLYGSLINLGLWIGIIPGLIIDKFGPKISVFIGGTMLSGTYLGLYFITSMKSNEFPFYVIILIGFLLGQGACLCQVSSLSMNLKNFKIKSDNYVVGILMAIHSISPSVFANYKEYFSKIMFSQYFLSLSILSFIFMIIATISFKVLENPYSKEESDQKYQKYKEKQYLRVFFIITFINFLIYVIGIFVNYFDERMEFPNMFIFPGIQLSIIFSLIFEKCQVFEKCYQSKYLKKHVMTEMLNPKLFQIEQKNNQLDKKSGLEIQENLEIDDSKNLSPQNDELAVTSEKAIYDEIVSQEFILVFFILSITIGCSISNLNNIKFLSSSIIFQVTHREIFEYVAFYFVFNCFSRLFLTCLMKILIKHNIFFHLLVLIAFLSLLSQVSGLVLTRFWLFASISLDGCVHGGMMIFASTFIKNYFNSSNYATLFGILSTGSGIGSIIITQVIFIPNEDKLNSDCFGKNCFYKSYIWTTLLTSLNLIFSFIILYSFKIKKNSEKKRKASAQQSS